MAPKTQIFLLYLTKERGFLMKEPATSLKKSCAIRAIRGRTMKTVFKEKERKNN